jgi:hypothetical protein
MPARKQTLEAQLAELNKLRADPTAVTTLETLRQALASKTNHVAAKAARIAAEFELEPLEADLAAAFERLIARPWQADQGCAAKMALAEALYRLGAHRERVFLQGIRHRQPEPVYGGQEDTAPKLRAVCALGLVRMNYPEVMIELADLLADPEPEARLGAVRAIGYANQDIGAPLLRFKARLGDEKIEVLQECFGVLLKLAPASSLPFVAAFLDAAEPAICETAALALGESRLAEALDFLKTAWDKTLTPDLRRTLLLAMTLLRRKPAIEFILSLIADGSVSMAREAVTALRLYQADEEVWRQVERLVEARGDIDLNNENHGH